MKRFILISIGLLLWAQNVTFAQFNTITQSKAQRKTISISQSSLIIQEKDNAADPICDKQTETERTDLLPAIVSPLRHIVVTSPYGLRTDPFTKKKARHNGLDLKAYYEPAYAMMYGEVIRVGKDKRSGLFVTLRHGDFTISYCHLSKIAVSKGIHVYPGTILALAGNTGRSSGEHLHLTLKKDGKTINPAILLNLIKQTTMGNTFADNRDNSQY
ncbi:MAG: M23 family metallopeptidase [Prevotellaceae bacterium]|nr:M23 family metallopeptidase [Prevotellaceae bacterium]